MAQSLKLRVVAEGVETAEELAFLHAHHCEEAQGYYFSRPVPAERFAELLAAGISSESRNELRALNDRLDDAVLRRSPRGATLFR
jgi:sensor c-di-GMP phosphodiesterase-like protein